MLNVAVFGATGRMGREMIRVISSADDCRLTGATVRPGSAEIGRDSGEAASAPQAGVRLCGSPAEALAGAHVAIDFASPGAARDNLTACVKARCALLIGATGHDDGARRAMKEASARIPILLAPNASLGARVLRRLARLATEALPADYDVAVLDFHRRHKRDAPSGTALELAEAIAASRTGGNEVSFAAVRAGDIVGEHTVLLVGAGERIEITHRVQHRSSFAGGALAAARWLAGQPPGLYGMDDLP